MIEITGVDLKQFAKDVYDLSVPQGLGFLHAIDGGLSDEDAENLVDSDDEYSPLRMDYVHGRSCKMVVFKKDDKLFINSPWYDHSDSHLQELLSRHGIEYTKKGSHGDACNCPDCRISRGKTASPTFDEVLQ